MEKVFYYILCITLILRTQNRIKTHSEAKEMQWTPIQFMLYSCCVIFNALSHSFWLAFWLLFGGVTRLSVITDCVSEAYSA